MATINVSKIIGDSTISIKSPELEITSTGVPLLKISSQKLCLSTIVDVDENRIINVGDPISPSDAATKLYIDNKVKGLNIHQAVKSASVSNILLSSQIFEVDDVMISVKDRVLVKNQTNSFENGIYIVDDNHLLIRDDDLLPGSKAANVFMYVTTGTINGDSQWACTASPDHDTVGLDPIEFSLMSSTSQLIAGKGLIKTGIGLDLNADSKSIRIENNIVSIEPTFFSTGLEYGNDHVRVDPNLSHVTIVGNLVGGTWNATKIDVPFGGSGRTAHISNGILVGNDTNPICSYSNLTFDGNNLRLTGKFHVNDHHIEFDESDIFGQISYLDVTPSSNNADIPSFLFASSKVRTFIAHVYVEIKADIDLYELVYLKGIQLADGWRLFSETNGDKTGVIFNITANGQVQYSLDNVPNFVTGAIKFKASTLAL